MHSYPPAGHFDDLLYRVAVGRVHQVGRSESGRGLQLGWVGVDRNDAPRSGDVSAVDRRHTDAAATDHRHRLSRPHLGRIHRGAEAGHHPAPDQRGAVERLVVAHIHNRILVHQHLLRERGQVGKRVRPPRLVPLQAIRLPGLQLHLGVAAQRWRPVVQYSQVPQNTDRQVMTRSSGFT